MTRESDSSDGASAARGDRDAEDEENQDAPGGGASEIEHQLASDIGSSRTPESPVKRRRIDGGFAVVIAVAVISGTLVLWRRGPERFFEIMVGDLGLILSIAPKIVAALLLAAWLRRLAPKETIARWFGSESGFTGMSLAVIAGIILPGGPMTAFPIAVAFGAAGAESGVAAAFLTSWLLLSANRTIVWEMAFIDHEVVGWRVLLSLPIPFIVGYAVRLLGWPKVPLVASGGPTAPSTGGKRARRGEASR